MDIRLEAFNIFNRVILGRDPTTDFSSNNFGLITLRPTPRGSMQIGLKLYW